MRRPGARAYLWSVARNSERPNRTPNPTRSTTHRLRNGVVVALFALGAAACSTVPATDLPEQAQVTTTTAPAPTTTVPPSTTAPPTTAAPTTAVPITTVTPTPGSGELEELPYTGPSEAVLFALIGLTMVVVGRSVLDVCGVLGRVQPTGRRLPPR
jgi:hypothetical protein